MIEVDYMHVRVFVCNCAYVFFFSFLLCYLCFLFIYFSCVLTIGI